MVNYSNDHLCFHRCARSFILAFITIQEWSRMEVRYYFIILSTRRSLWFLIVGLSFGLQVSRSALVPE